MKPESKNNLFVSIVMVLLVITWSVVLRSNTQNSRGPSSLDPRQTKERPLMTGLSKRLPVQGKGHGLIEVVIAAPKKGAVGHGTTIDLEATVEARADLDGLKFLWILPRSGVSHVAGHIEGELGSLKEAEQSKLMLSIRNDTDENHRVHLHVYRVINGENMGKMAQYNTVDQEAIEWVAKEKSEKIKTSIEVHGNTFHKIYQ
jgi:hypothetical protein